MGMDGASQATEENRRAALAAMARAGTEGADAYQQAQQQVRSSQDQAISGALAGAAARGAPAGAAGELANIVRGPGDVATQRLAAAQGRYAAGNAADTGATDAYFREASAAVPVIQAAAQREAAWQAQKAKEAAAKKATTDAQWEQKALSYGLAEMQSQAERQKRLNDQAEQQRYLAAPVSNPTYDAIGAALASATGQGTPAELAKDQQIMANPTAGASYRAPNGQVVQMTPSVADPHYMGSMLDDQVSTLAREIAANRIPDDVQAQRDAYTAAYGDDLRTQALARGIFQPPTPTEQVSSLNAQRALQNYDQFGYPSASAASADQSAMNRLSSTDSERSLVARAGFDNVEQLHSVMASPAYASMKAVADDIVAAGHSLDDLKYQLDIDPAYASKPLTKRLILAQYASLLPSGAYIPR